MTLHNTWNTKIHNVLHQYSAELNLCPGDKDYILNHPENILGRIHNPNFVPAIQNNIVLEDTIASAVLYEHIVTSESHASHKTQLSMLLTALLSFEPENVLPLIHKRIQNHPGWRQIEKHFEILSDWDKKYPARLHYYASGEALLTCQKKQYSLLHGYISIQEILRRGGDISNLSDEEFVYFSKRNPHEHCFLYELFPRFRHQERVTFWTLKSAFEHQHPLCREIWDKAVAQGSIFISKHHKKYSVYMNQYDLIDDILNSECLKDDLIVNIIKNDQLQFWTDLLEIHDKKINIRDVLVQRDIEKVTEMSIHF